MQNSKPSKNKFSKTSMGEILLIITLSLLVLLIILIIIL